MAPNNAANNADGGKNDGTSLNPTTEKIIILSKFLKPKIFFPRLILSNSTIIFCGI